MAVTCGENGWERVTSRVVTECRLLFILVVDGVFPSFLAGFAVIILICLLGESACREVV